MPCSRCTQAGEDIESVVRTTLQDTGDINRVELGLSACAPACPDSPTLVRAVSQAANLGVRSVSIDNYGLLPLRRLEWIKQASRYAGREAR